MRESPPSHLVDLLGRLHLATPKQLHAVSRRARRLAGELPLFDSIWIDALVQARLLTPFQAAEINAGRGEQLLVGPYVIRRKIQRLGYADCFLAVEAVSDEQKNHKRQQSIHVLVARGLDPIQAEDSAARLQIAIERLASIDSEHLPQLQAAGAAGDMLWAAYHAAAGFPAIDWLSCQGRLPPAIVMEIARQMTSTLAAIESAGALHGSISVESLWLHESGSIQLAHCGFKAAFSANHSCADDLFACGSLWWHLLTGRQPIATGNNQSVPNVRQLAPEVDPSLAQAADLCTRQDPSERPESFGAVREMLGPSATLEFRPPPVTWVSKSHELSSFRYARLTRSPVLL